MAKAKFVPIIFLLIIICANQSFCDNFRENLSQETNNGIISRRMDVDRQGLIGSSLLGGPLAIAAFLFSLPVIPALLMAPLAVAGLRPTIGAVGQFMNSMNSGGGFAQGIASLLTPPSVDSAEAASNSVASTTSADSSGSMSPFTSALRSISELIFKRRFSNQFFNRFQFQPKPPNKPTDSDEKPNDSSDSPQNRIATLMSSLREVYGILSNGLRRYEITDSDCQSRIICEVHQKAVGKSASLGSFTAQLLDLIGVESHLDRSNAVSERAKSFIKDFVRAAKTGLTLNDCSQAFNRCLTSSAPESPQFNRINGLNGLNAMNAMNGLNGDHLKAKPNIYDINQLLHTKFNPHKPNRLAIKSAFATTPRTVSYYSNIKQNVI